MVDNFSHFYIVGLKKNVLSPPKTSVTVNYKKISFNLDSKKLVTFFQNTL